MRFKIKYHHGLIALGMIAFSPHLAATQSINIHNKSNAQWTLKIDNLTTSASSAEEIKNLDNTGTGIIIYKATDGSLELKAVEQFKKGYWHIDPEVGGKTKSSSKIYYVLQPTFKTEKVAPAEESKTAKPATATIQARKFIQKNRLNFALGGANRVYRVFSALYDDKSGTIDVNGSEIKVLMVPSSHQLPNDTAETRGKKVVESDAAPVVTVSGKSYGGVLVINKDKYPIE